MSRLLSAAERARVRPMSWRLAGQPSAPSRRPTRVLEVEAQPAGEDLSPLHARIVELERQAEQRARESYQTGVREGEAQQKSQAAAELLRQLETWAGKVAELVDTRAQMLRQAESDVLHLSVEIARRILHRELTVDPAALESLVSVALRKLEFQEVHRVRVYPEFEPAMRTALQRFGGGSPIEVVSDQSLERGGIVFEISRGNLDVSVDTQLKEIERGLIDRLEDS